jgi:hypothetical protein
MLVYIKINGKITGGDMFIRKGGNCRANVSKINIKSISTGIFGATICLKKSSI